MRKAVRARMPHGHGAPSNSQVSPAGRLSVPAMVTLRPIASTTADSTASGLNSMPPFSSFPGGSGFDSSPRGARGAVRSSFPVSSCGGATTLGAISRDVSGERPGG